VVPSHPLENYTILKKGYGFEFGLPKFNSEQNLVEKYLPVLKQVLKYILYETKFVT
jgi:hypothetical protein